MAGAVSRVHAASDVVLYPSNFATVRGNWSVVASTGSAGNQKLTSADSGWASLDTPLASPPNYVEATFSAAASTDYHVWVRLRAANDSKYNDSVWVQFSDAVDRNGSRVHEIGSTRGLMMNLENCKDCGVGGWGWQDKAYWLQQANVVRFTTSGSHTIRIQTREDGVQFDQVVLSPATYLSGRLGQVTSDSTIVPQSSSTTTTSVATGARTPFSGTPAVLPGQVNSETFDNGGEGVAYHDTSAGNSGGQVRGGDVDIESSTDGGFNVGWITPGEWLNYTVNVTAAGSYNLQLRVASPNGASMHVGFNGPSSVWSAVNVPATGGWQSWTTVNVPVQLGAGTQVMTLMFDAGTINLRYAKAVSNTTTAAPTPTPAPASGNGPFSGSPINIPGKVEAEAFDNGADGNAYHDSTPGNSGGQYRSTNVDLESASEGSYDIGWSSGGEWLNYSVNVTSGGNYTAQMRVAAPNGGQMHIGFNGSSKVWAVVNVPSTGGWQSWTTVNVPISLGAGTQLMTILFDSAVNFNYVNVVPGSTSTPPPPPPPPPPSSSSGTTTLSVLTWNVQINDFTEGHARSVIDRALAVGPRPQIITIQEAWSDFFPAYIDELQRQTGQTWYGAYQQLCPPGGWNGSSCTKSWDQVVAIFSVFPIQNTSAIHLPFADCWTSARPGLRIQVNVGGVPVQVFTTHMQTGGCGDDRASRSNSMQMLKSWAANFSKPQILSGDFNADPDQITTTSGMAPAFTDTWSLVGSGRGFTALGGTPTMKLDYWFTDAGRRADPVSTQVIYGTGGISDHFPVQTTFVIR